MVPGLNSAVSVSEHFALMEHGFSTNILRYRDLEDFSFRFCLYNLKAVIQTDGFLTWDNNISRGFIVRAAEHTVFNP